MKRKENIKFLVDFVLMYMSSKGMNTCYSEGYEAVSHIGFDRTVRDLSEQTGAILAIEIYTKSTKF